MISGHCKFRFTSVGLPVSRPTDAISNHVFQTQSVQASGFDRPGQWLGKQKASVTQKLYGKRHSTPTRALAQSSYNNMGSFNACCVSLTWSQLSCSFEGNKVLVVNNLITLTTQPVLTTLLELGLGILLDDRNTRLFSILLI